MKQKLFLKLRKTAAILYVGRDNPNIRGKWRITEAISDKGGVGGNWDTARRSALFKRRNSLFIETGLDGSVR